MTILPQLERDLRDAALQRAPSPAPAGGPRRRGWSVVVRARAALIAAAAGLACATVALAATGVILTGSPVHARRGQTATAALGLPRPGGAVLLGLRVADPAGGLPWGIRIVHTTRGVVCLQVGRVKDNELGVLGVDGAFGNDGRFHPVAADVLPAALGGLGVNVDVMCDEPPPATHAYVDAWTGISATPTAPGPVPPPADRRVLSFGLLGGNAVSVRYTQGGRMRTEPIGAPDGAYLIVQAAGGSHNPRVVQEEDNGIDDASGEFLNLTAGPWPLRPAPGPLMAITYRIHGRLCSDQPIERLPACPQPAFTPPKPLPLLHEALHPVFTITHGRVTALTVRFHAPYAITSANQDYVLFSQPQTQSCSSPGQASGGVAHVARADHDLPAGATVTLTVANPFRGACGRTLTVRVGYDNSLTLQTSFIGSAVLSAPR
jgi:hypothetical protein